MTIKEYQSLKPGEFIEVCNSIYIVLSKVEFLKF